MNLRCHCDHCPNSTCITPQNGLCWGQLSLDKNGEIEEKFNCLRQDSRFLQTLICDPAAATVKTSNTILKCCNSTDYCNQKDGFLPPAKEAKRILLQAQASSKNQLYLLRNPDSEKQASDHGYTLPTTESPHLVRQHKPLGIFLEQFSTLPLELKVIFIILSGLLLIIAIALAQHGFSKRRRQQRSSRWNGQGHHCDEDYSENSSAKVNSEAGVYDTNSMASREPLINGSAPNPLANKSTANNLLVDPNPLGGPWMREDSHTITMSLGCRKRAFMHDTSSGSGSGQAYLSQRSIAHDISLLEVVGRGYFGVVWRGEYKGQPVAVKIFAAMAEPSWRREAEIYQTTLLHHKNILGFIATDKRNDSTMTGFWLVTDYYPMGSLFDFLRRSSLSMLDALRMAFSISNGLSHLHSEIFGTQGKPSIAHRDLKSKNILVKNDGTCCIADLGMAVRYCSVSGAVDAPKNTRLGTRRYLAPEILMNRLNLMDFETVKAADVYAMGLVMWEILRRTCYAQPSYTAGSVPKLDNSQQPEHRISPQLDSPEVQIEYCSSVKEQPASSTAQTSSIKPISPCPISNPEFSSIHMPSPVLNNEPIASTSQAEMGQRPERPKHDRQQHIANNNEPRAVETPSEPDSSLPTKQLDESDEDSDYYYRRSFEESCTNLNQFAEEEDPTQELAFVCDPYEAPYQRYVSADPSASEMREVVCVQKKRPPPSKRWIKFRVMREYTTLMRECWAENPRARLTALRVRMSLGNLGREYFNVNMEYD